MRLLTCVTENFKKLGNFSADFTTGLNIIAGDNANGKSTLLEAIGVCFFGVTMASVKKENIPTWGQDKFSVTNTFQLHGPELYTCFRTGNTAKLTRTLPDGSVELVANGATPVRAKMEELLGLVADDWNLFVQSEQGSSAGILKYGAAALNRKVEAFAGVELIDKVQAEAQRQATVNNSHADAKSVDDEVMKAAEADLQEASEALQLASVNVEAAVQQQEAHGSFSVEVPASSKEMRKQMDAVVNLSNKITLAETNVGHAQQRVNEAQMRVEGVSLQDGDAIRNDMAGLKTQGLELAAAKGVLVEELAVATAAKQKVDETDLALDTQQQSYTANWAEFDHDAAEVELDAVTEYIATQQKDIERESEAVGQAKAKYDNLLSLSDGAVCPTCNRAKEDHDPVKLKAEADEAKKWWDNRVAYVAELKAGLVTFQTSRKNLNDKLTAFEDATVKIDAALAAHTAAKEALAPLRALNVIQDELSGAEGQVNEARDSYAAMGEKLKGVEANNTRVVAEQKALTKAQDELTALQAGLQTLNDELEALPEPPTEKELAHAELLEQEYQVARAAWADKSSSLSAAVTQAKSEHGFRVKLHAAAQEKLDGLKSSAAASVEHLVLSKKYTRLVQFLRDRRQQYLKEVWDTITGIASRLVRVASKDTITKIDNVDGEFMFEEAGIMAPSSSASGAQKAMIGVSLRVGLGRALYGKDALLIFDEPTESCREHNAASLAAMIATSAKQVLMITHRETDQALAENIVNVGE
jgi:DNA repair exonuclease SbcCD ATPase subunit